MFISILEGNAKHPFYHLTICLSRVIHKIIMHLSEISIMFRYSVQGGTKIYNATIDLTMV